MLWHPIPWVSRAAMSNPSTPLLAKRAAVFLQPRMATFAIADDFTPGSVLLRAASRARTDTSQLKGIARHRNATAAVLQAAVQHSNADTATLVTALTHPAADHRVVTAVFGLQFGDSADRFAWPAVHVVLAWNPGCSGAVLQWLTANTADARVLASVAQHPNAPEDVAVEAALGALGSVPSVHGHGRYPAT